MIKKFILQGALLIIVIFSALYLATNKTPNVPFISQPTRVGEIFINDKGIKYTISIEKTYPNAIKAEAPYPDIRIISNENTFMELFKSKDIMKTAADFYKKNLIAVELIEDINTLTLKGYKQIYEEVTQESGLWKLIINSRGIRTTVYLTIVILLCIFTFWYLRYK